jgi:hypothetical protein
MFHLSGGLKSYAGRLLPVVENCGSKSIAQCEKRSYQKKRVVEGKTILSKPSRINHKKSYRNFTGHINFICLGKISITNDTPLLPPVLFDQVHLAELPDRFRERTIRRLRRSIAELQFTSFRHQAPAFATTIHDDMGITIVEVKLSRLLGHLGG